MRRVLSLIPRSAEYSVRPGFPPHGKAPDSLARVRKMGGGLTAEQEIAEPTSRAMQLIRYPRPRETTRTNTLNFLRIVVMTDHLVSPFKFAAELPVATGAPMKSTTAVKTAAGKEASTEVRLSSERVASGDAAVVKTAKRSGMAAELSM